jgi:amino acid transporter/nucleotide-binding universal stress UspA family protein
MKEKLGTNRVETELSRDLGLTSALAIGIGTMIAAGIFTLSGLAIRNVGSSAIIAFFLAALVALFTALTYCEFVSIYPSTGEGYLYARKTYSPPLAYFVGWALFLGYASSCAFYIASLSSYFNEFIWEPPLELLSGLLLLAALTLLNVKGTKESGKFQVIVTGAKIVLLIWFIFGGLSFVNLDGLLERLSTDFVKIGSTAAMVFITFFGFSAIAASAGEVKNPVRNIPRAIFISMAVVTVLYTLVVMVVLFAGITEYTEASMGQAAQKFLGAIGGYIIIAGAIFSMISASNASIMAGSRVILSMSRMQHMPREIGIINSRTKTPIIAVLAVGTVIMIFTLILPLEDLSFFANTVLLLSLIFVNAALIVHRKKFPDIERPFKVPLVPLLPLLGILANIYLLVQILQHPLPLLVALGALLLGLVAFVAWKGSQAEEAAIPGLSSHIAHSQGRGTSEKQRFRIMVPLANPETAENLIRLAAAVARDKEGEILLLRVIRIPEQLPPTAFDESDVEKEEQWLKSVRQIAEAQGIPTHALIRVGHNVARAILETSRERYCDLIILGWKGYSSGGEQILGQITEDVITHARTDIMFVKMVGDTLPRSILMPSAGGEHAQCAEQYAVALARSFKGDFTVCQVAPVAIPDDAIAPINQRLQEARERILNTGGNPKLPPLKEVRGHIIRSDSVAKGIIKDAAGYDAVMVGAAGKSIYPKILFGNIPLEIAKGVNKTVIVVKHFDPVKALVGRVVGE